MSYRDSQFYKFPVGERNSATDNPPFAYPGGTAQTFTKSGTKKVQRGFIKSLMGGNSAIFQNLGIDETQANSPVFNKRMWFQFNPETLSQDVSMSEGLTNPYLQDAGQFTQPVAAMQNFSFNILLDRQFEMNRRSQSVAPDSPYFTGPNAVTNDPIFTSTDPGDIGVLADLKVLFAIIGQGLSSEQVTFFKKLAELQSATSRDTSESTDQLLDENGTPVTPGSGFTFADGRNSLDSNINLGNFAFLSTLPVRVVFSSLFMVDGFITRSSVLYTKFNANMVPVQCTVNLQMQATYIGFARQDTILTEALKVVKPTSVAASDPGADTGTPAPSLDGSPEDRQLLKKWLTTGILRQFRLRVYAGGGDHAWGDGPPSSATFSIDNGFKERICGDSSLGLVYGFKYAPSSYKDDEIYNYMNDKTGDVAISYSWDISVYREPFGTETASPDIDTSVTDGYSLLIWRLTRSSINADGMDGADTATTPSQYDALRRVLDENVNPDNSGMRKPGWAGNRLGSDFWLSQATATELYGGVSPKKKIKVVLTFNMTASVASPGKSPSTWSLPTIRKTQYASPYRLFLEWDFDTNPPPRDTPSGIPGLWGPRS
jgi:hypothetical protein